MIESGYYPPGAEFDPNAPYNQSEPDDRAFECEVTETISRTVDVYTNKYTVYEERDEDMGFGYYSIETDYVDWNEEYDNQYSSLPELLKDLKGFIVKHVDVNKLNWAQRKEMERLLEQCDGWELVERDIGEA